MKQQTVVADAGPLIHLDELNCLDILNDFSQVLVPAAVRHEVLRHRPQVFQRSDVLLEVSAPPVSPRVEALSAVYTLHHGEREALALCVESTSSVFLSDDTAARLAAKSLEIVAHGTLGLPIRAVRMNRRSPQAVIELLTDIPRLTTLHIRPGLLDQVIEKVRTEWGSG